MSIVRYVVVECFGTLERTGRLRVDARGGGDGMRVMLPLSGIVLLLTLILSIVD